jgi:hypothetical protein
VTGPAGSIENRREVVSRAMYESKEIASHSAGFGSHDSLHGVGGQCAVDRIAAYLHDLEGRAG